MRYVADHDYHIHSFLSSCSPDENEIPVNIIKIAEENGYSSICLTDHFWDDLVPGASGWYEPQNFAHISEALPLPQNDKVKFYFGCEAEMDKFGTIGIAKERLDKFDFIIVPTTHMHMMGFAIDEADNSIERRAVKWVERFDALLDADLPFYKVGIAHITCPLIANVDKEAHIRVLDLISDEEMTRLFTKAATVGLGIELNFNPFQYDEILLEKVLRPYRIAKKCGCKFYLGSDAHHTSTLKAGKEKFEFIVDKLDLQESDKFTFIK